MTRFALPALMALALTSAAPAQEWKAGAAKVAITPTQPMWMSGYSSRTKPAEGKETELWAKALVLEDASGARSILVTLDLVGIGRDVSQDIVAAVRAKHPVARERLALSVSHTHCGPVVGHNLNSMYFLDAEHAALVKAYAAALPKRVAEAVDAAVAKLAPAKVSWATGACDFAVNRRENKEAEIDAIRAAGKLKGPVDHDVPVLAVRDANGKLTAVAFGYACHATVLSYQKWCGDYPGFAMLALEERHAGAVALFWAGCGADQNPLPRRTVALAQSYGTRLADAVDQVLAKPGSVVKAASHAIYEEIPLALGELPNREKLVEESTSTNKYLAARAKANLVALEKSGTLPKTYPYPVQTWRLGDDLVWTMLGGEVVVEYSLRLKREAGSRWVMGYANDVMAYIPSVKVLKEGGYEGASSMIYYGLPTVWSPRVEDSIVAAVFRQTRKQ